MAQSDVFRRMLDAGTDFTELTQRRAERLVQALVDAGEVQRDQAQKAVHDLLKRSRKNRKRFLAAVDREVQASVERMELATKAELARLENQIARLLPGSTATTTPVKKKAPAKKAPAKKAPAKKAPAKKAPAKKTPAKKTPAKKTPAKKAPAKKTPAKKTPAKKTAATKAPARRGSARS